MKTTNWTKVLIIGGGALLGLALVLNLFAPLLWQQFGDWGYPPGGYAGWGMMRDGNGPSVMHYHPFWGPGMFIGWLFPLSLLALLMAGIVWLLQAAGRSTTAPMTTPPALACPNCGQPVQANWHNCPYCGTSLVQTQTS
jgi:hypothetical protein